MGSICSHKEERPLSGCLGSSSFHSGTQQHYNKNSSNPTTALGNSKHQLPFKYQQTSCFRQKKKKNLLFPMCLATNRKQQYVPKITRCLFINDKGINSRPRLTEVDTLFLHSTLGAASHHQCDLFTTTKTWARFLLPRKHLETSRKTVLSGKSSARQNGIVHLNFPLLLAVEISDTNRNYS